MEFAMSPVGEGAVAPDATPAHALEEPRQEVDPVSAPRSPAPGLAAADLLYLRPQRVRDRRIGPPRCWTSGFVRPAVAADPAVVERVHQDHPDARLGEAGLGREEPRADRSERVAREQTDGRVDRRRIDLEGVGWLCRASEAERGVSAGIGLLVELGG